MLMLIRSTHPKDDHGLLRFGLQHGFPIISTGCCTNQRKCWTTGTLQFHWNEVWQERRAAKSKPFVPKMGDPSRELWGVLTRTCFSYRKLSISFWCFSSPFLSVVKFSLHMSLNWTVLTNAICAGGVRVTLLGCRGANVKKVVCQWSKKNVPSMQGKTLCAYKQFHHLLFVSLQ